MKHSSLTLSVAGGMVLLILLPVFYVLSVGPVVWVLDRYPLFDPLYPLAETIYLPLEYLANTNDTIEALLEWYISFWENPAAFVQ